MEGDEGREVGFELIWLLALARSSSDDSEMGNAGRTAGVLGEL